MEDTWHIKNNVEVYLHPPSASRVHLPHGRHLAYQEQGVPADRARFSLIAPHYFLSSRLAELSKVYMFRCQIQTLLEKINGIELKNTESFATDPVKKLFYVVNTVAQLQHHLELSARDKEELQSRLSESVQEMEHLRKEAGNIISINQELEHSKSDLAKLAFDLEKTIRKFGGDELIKEQKSVTVRNLSPVLEKLIKDLILESENSKAKAQELGVELHGNKKFIDELSAKVALLEVPVRKGVPPSDEEHTVAKKTVTNRTCIV